MVQFKTYGSHGVYSKELNKFISVTDKDNFKIGTEIAKIDNNKITYVKVSNIEIISEKQIIIKLFPQDILML